MAERTIRCLSCKKEKNFATVRGIWFHYQDVHRNLTYPCLDCGNFFKFPADLEFHIPVCQMAPPPPPPPPAAAAAAAPPPAAANPAPPPAAANPAPPFAAQVRRRRR